MLLFYVVNLHPDSRYGTYKIAYCFWKMDDSDTN